MVPDVSQTRHAADARRIQKAVSFYIFDSFQRAFDQPEQVTAIHLTVAVHHRYQVCPSIQTIEITCFCCRADAAIAIVSKLCKPLIRDSREYFPGVVRASVIDHYYEVDEAGHSLNCLLDVRLFVVNRHHNCHGLVPVHYCPFRVNPPLSIVDCIHRGQPAKQLAGSIRF